MKLAKFLILILPMSLSQCIDIDSFQPLPPYYHWNFPGSYKYFENSKGVWDFFTKRENDMRACGMDPVDGESMEAKVNLCLEGKGWYLKEGPICEEQYFWNDPLCIKWRAKHSKPGVQPWTKNKN